MTSLDLIDSNETAEKSLQCNMRNMNKFHRVSDFRTSSQIGHKYIPPVNQNFESFRITIPEKLVIRDQRLQKAGLISTYSKSYDVKPLDIHGERFSQGGSLLGVKYLDSTQTRFFRDPPRPILPPKSTMKDSYSAKHFPRFPELKDVHNIETEAFCKLQTLGLQEQPSIPPEEKGYMKLLDPYLTTSRKDHIPFTKSQWNGVAKKDVLTIYDFIEPKIPKCKGFGVKEIPSVGQVIPFKVDPIADKIPFKFTPKLEIVPTKHKHVPHMGMSSETQSKFCAPSMSSDYWIENGGDCLNYSETWPTEMQWKLMPGSYYTESGHIGTGHPIGAVIDQNSRHKSIQKRCCRRTN